jgi:stage V sporulation protein T
MYCTGIVRRIDDLGRVVIPKEIRRTLGIKEGDPLEIYTDNDTVIFKKFNELSFFDVMNDLINNQDDLTTEEKTALFSTLNLIKKNKEEKGS